MRALIALLFGRSAQPIDRATYVTAGLSLMVVKYVVDAALIFAVAGVVWTPIDYLLPMISFSATKVAAFPAGLSVALLVWALPFIWIGVSMSMRRAIDAAVFPGIVVTFFLPLLNYVLMTVLALAPSRVIEPKPWVDAPVRDEPQSRRALTRSGWLGILAGAATGLAAAGVGVMMLRTYGSSIFLGTPFLIGLVSAVVANRLEEQTGGEAIRIGQLALLAAGATLIVFALEGIVCLLMALPIASPLAILGSFVGHLLAQRRRPTSFSHLSILFCLLSVG